MITKHIHAIANRVVLMWGWKRLGLSFVCGLISALALAPFHLFPILFLTLPVFVWILDGAATDPTQSLLSRMSSFFKAGWVFAFGFHLMGMWWIGNAFLVDAETFAWLLPFAVAALPAALALFFAVAIAFARLFWSEQPSRILVAAVAIGLAEYARGTLLTGLPWNLLGYAAMPVPIAMQTASVIGAYGVTMLCIPVFCVLALFSTSQERARPKIMMLFLAFALFAGHLGFGVIRLSDAPQDFVENVSLRIVQPAIAQKDKFDPEKEAEIFKRYLDLSTGVENGVALSDVTHLIWPESAFPFVLTERRDALSAIGAMLPPDTSLITGAARVEPSIEAGAEPYVFNSVYMIDPDGIVTDASDKVHLVPFGEYLPFQDLLESFGLQQLTQVRGGFEAGNARKTLRGKSGPAFIPLICYEIIFPGQVAEGDHDAQWLVNLTNDAWFGHTPGPYQHLHQSVVRSVEEGLPLVRSANTGISSVTDPYGRTVKRLGYGETGFLDSPLPVKLNSTFYSWMGNIPFFILSGLFLVLAVSTRKP